MKQEDKELLLKDLSARLPYNLKGKVYAEVSDGKYDMNGDMIFYDAPFDVILDKIDLYEETIHVTAIGNEDTVEFIEIQQTDCEPYTIEEFKPYLRPMSTMTKEEIEEFTKLIFITDSTSYGYLKECLLYSEYSSKAMDWLNSHHFDYRGLIDQHLALQAPENMYNK